MDEEPAVLISILGTEPQILTLTLSHLLDKGVPIAEVVGIYPQTDDRAIVSGIHRLEEAWDGLPFAHRIKLTLSQIRVADITSEEDLKVVYRKIRYWVHSFKSRGWSIFLNVSGGRKPIAICAFIVAQFLFSSHDHLIYLVSSPSLVRSRKFVADPLEYTLIDLPIPLWSEEGSVLKAISQYDDPWTAAVIQRKFLRRDTQYRWMHFLRAVLTPAERRVVEELVVRGGTNADIGKRIHRSTRTVGHQLSATFRKLRNFLGLSPDSTIDRTTVVSLLAPHIRADDLLKMGNSPDVIDRKWYYD